jgi:hypothetical protein
MIDIFNHHFKMRLGLGDNNGINIYKANSMQEILNFLATPIPFCRYCAIEKRTYNHPWGISKKDIKEWS